MKNIVLGCIGCFMVLYTVLMGLSVYSLYTRKNQAEKCLSTVLENAMDRYYLPKFYSPDWEKTDDSRIEEELVMDIEERFSEDRNIDVIIYVCDMEKGIISAEISEEFTLPMGIDKKINCRKTIVADRDDQ